MNKCNDCGASSNLFGLKYRKVRDGTYYQTENLNYRCVKCLPPHLESHKKENYWEVIIVTRPNKPLEVKMRTI